MGLCAVRRSGGRVGKIFRGMPEDFLCLKHNKHIQYINR